MTTKDVSSLAALQNIREVHQAATGRWTGLGWKITIGDGKEFRSSLTSAACLSHSAGWRAVARLDFSPIADVLDDGAAASCVGAVIEHLGLKAACLRRRKEDMEDYCLRETDSWKEAAEEILEIEESAAQAEAAAAEALAYAEAGDLDAALESAKFACRMERQYGDDPTWRGLRLAIESAIRSRDAARSGAAE